MLSLSSLDRACGLRRATIAVALLTASFCASAALVTSRGSLGGDDWIDWAQLGPDGATVTQPGAVLSDQSLDAEVSNASGGDIFRFDEGAGTYSGNFDAGDALLATLLDVGPIRIRFAGPVARVGAQIQSMVNGHFIGILTAFGTTDDFLESVSLGGESTRSGDNSAIFIGMTRAKADIGRIEFSVTLIDPDQTADFAINRLDFGLQGTGVPPEPVPEPGSLALVGAALAASTWRRRAVTA